jgi:hypothetical protein
MSWTEQELADSFYESATRDFNNQFPGLKETMPEKTEPILEAWEELNRQDFYIRLERRGLLGKAEKLYKKVPENKRVWIQYGKVNGGEEPKRLSSSKGKDQ